VFIGAGGGAAGAENEKPRRGLARLRENGSVEIWSEGDYVSGKAARVPMADLPGKSGFAKGNGRKHRGCE
jgi:hypothetical protein